MSLDAIGIACRNIDKSIEFYNLLGVEFKEFGEGHFEGKTKSGVRIMLDSFELLKKINPNWIEPGQSGITLAFFQSKPTKVDGIFKTITEKGFHGEKEPWDAFWGQRYASIKDPDNNQIDLFAPL